MRLLLESDWSLYTPSGQEWIAAKSRKSMLVKLCAFPNLSFHCLKNSTLFAGNYLPS